MQVIGAGYGRTGTLSLKKALEILGFDPCYHMVEVFKNKGHDQFWYNASIDSSNMNWDDVFGEYKASVDFPACLYYNELLKYYPDAKVVLSVRDADGWYKSASNTIYKASTAVWGPAKYLLHRNLRKMINAVIWDGEFNGEFNNEEKTKEIFNNHIDKVKKDVPNDKLLVFSVKEGWEPLCNFLNLPIPNEPFPHLNDTEEFKKRFLYLNKIALITNIIIVSVPITICGLGYYFYNRKQ